MRQDLMFVSKKRNWKLRELKWLFPDHLASLERNLLLLTKSCGLGPTLDITERKTGFAKP